MSERLQRYVLWMLAVSLVLGTALALRYARGYRPAAGIGLGPASVLPGDIALRFDKVRVAGRKDNKRVWDLTAGRIDTTRARSRVDFSGDVEAHLLQQGRSRATFTAPQATYDVVARLLVAAGNVACVVHPLPDAARSQNPDAQNPLKIEAGQVVWNVGSKTVVCPGRVNTTLPGLTVQGDDLAVDLQTRGFTLKQVRGTATLTDDGPAGGLPAALNALKGLLP